MQVACRRDMNRIGWWLSAAKSGWVGVVGTRRWVSGGREINDREWLTLL